MKRVRGIPPGRAGRLWLQERLATAERGAQLLDHKLRILRLELQRLVLIETRTAESWDRAAREAERWSMRAGLQSGRRGFRLALPTSLAEVEVRTSSMMGVRYPSGATCRSFGEPASTSANAALLVAIGRHQEALAAAVEHAAAVAAVRALEDEIAVTRRRVRAIEERWLPRLQTALADLTLGLEEMEHAEGVRLRWSAGREAGP